MKFATRHLQGMAATSPSGRGPTVALGTSDYFGKWVELWLGDIYGSLGKKELPPPAWFAKSLDLPPYPHLGQKSHRRSFPFSSQCGQYDLAVWSWI